MSRFTSEKVPDGTAIIPVNGRYYPVQLLWHEEGDLTARGYRRDNGRPASFSKRYLAVEFLKTHVEKVEKIKKYNAEIDERNRIHRENREKPWLTYGREED